MTRLDLLLHRKGIDPLAETCLHALRDLMQVPVREVRVGTLWRFELASAADAGLRATLERAARRAGRYWNPNRDAGRWIASGEPVFEMVAAEVWRAGIWIVDGSGEDGEALTFFRAHGATSLETVRRGTLYQLALQVDGEAAARDLAADVACAQRRDRGLLANPHAQRAEMLYLAPPAANGRASRP